MDNTIQLYVDEEQEIKGYPITSPDRVIDENGVNIKEKLDNKANKSDLHSHSNKNVLDGITTNKITEWDNKSNFSGNYNDLTNKPTIPKASNYKTAYGTCSTTASTSEKVVVIDDPNWELEVGNIVAIMFSASNTASNVTFNINNTGAYPIWYGTSEYTSNSSTACGTANLHTTYMFNGTHWVWLTRGSYSSYTQASLGQGYGVCDTVESTLAKACTISSYTLAVGGIVSIKFTNAVPANSTLNIRTRGAKKIFYRGVAIIDGIIKAGDTATFIYDGTQYHLISLDNAVGNIPTKTSQLTNDSGFITKNDLPLIQQTSGQSTTTAMSQKAVTDYVNEKIVELKGRPIVSSVDEMKDTSAEYVLASTGTVWRYREYTIEKEVPLFTNLINETTVDETTINKRINSSLAYADMAGSFSTKFIPRPHNDGETIVVRAKGVNANGYSEHRVLTFLSSGNGSGGIPIGGLKEENGWTRSTEENGTICVYTNTVTTGRPGDGFKMTWRVKDTALTLEECLNVIVTINETIEYRTETQTIKEWYDTEIKDDSNPIEVVQVPGDSISAVMSQKAVTELIRNAIGSGSNGSDDDYDEEYEVVDSVDQMTDVTKMYVLRSTGTLWSYQETTISRPKNFFDVDKAQLNMRINSSGATTSYTGCLLTHEIRIPYDSSKSVTIGGLSQLNPIYSNNIMLTFYTEDKTAFKNVPEGTYGFDNTQPLTLPRTFFPHTAFDSTNYPLVVFRFGYKEGTVVTKDMVKDLYIYIDGENEEVTTREWLDSELKPNYAIEKVDSVEKMTDTSKNYILTTTGTIWSYTKTKGELKNLYNPKNVAYNKRLSGSPGALVTHNGYMATENIPFNFTSDNPVLIFKHKDTIDDNGTPPIFEKVAFINEEHVIIGTMYTQAGVDSSYLQRTKISSTETHFNLRYNVTNTETNGWQDIKYIIATFHIAQNTSISEGADLIEGIYSAEDFETVYQWTDTGVFSEDVETGMPSGSGGTGYIDLTIKINNTNKNVSDLDKRVRTLEAGSNSLVVPSAWQSAVDACIAKIKTNQLGRYCVTFPFFSDHHVRGGCVGLLIAKVMQECNIPFCVFGGDSISSGYMAGTDIMDRDEYAFKSLMSYIPKSKFIRTPGNHDGYCAVSADERYYYTKEQIYELFFRDIATDQNKHFDKDGTSLYVDDLASKVRFIGLDVNRVVINNANSSDSIKDYQITWLREKALKFNEPGWGIVFFSHQPISNHGHANLSNPTVVYDLLNEYVSSSDANKADIIGWFSGHLHKDLMYTQASNGTNLPFTQVIISSDATAIAYTEETKHAQDGSDQSHCIDFVTINRKDRIVKITRLGIGEDREFTF